MRKLSTIWALVRRDYALQYAGSLLGLIWVFIQNNLLILIYSAVFLGLNIGRAPSDQGFGAYLLSGLIFWLPLQELLLRGSAILSENRSLLKRSPVGADLLLWIPYVQYLLHFTITSLPAFLLLALRSELRLPQFLLAYPLAALAGLYLLMALHYLARANLLLKDLSPLIRLLSQLLFWSAPVLYRGEGWLGKINQWNPFTVFLQLFRGATLPVAMQPLFWPALLFYAVVAAFLLLAARRRLHAVALDHL
ncbi:MAG: ABC transporter permease [Leptospirales bacterium]|nr:ABC transporter permease [Leptospirales bacterium]